ncbi:MAG: hypothetical protein A49_22550 [Methyloceanibacter sp.]|nr:MAG: hypothetical protein A49_22550 [Methyloceanibacter sp.]
MSDPQCTPIPSSELAPQVRGALYALFGSVWRNPDECSVHDVLQFDVANDVPGIDSTSPPPWLTVYAKLRSTCELLARRPLSNVVTDLQADHVRLFGHSVRGACPPYELEYDRGEIIQQTAELADLAGFYAAFGLQLADSAFERPDHAAVECEFMGVLCAKEAWGLETGEPALAESCSDAQRLFLRDHLAKWLPAFACRVETGDPVGLYGRIASLARVIVNEDCRRFGIEVGPQWLELRPADPDRDAAIDCETTACGDPATNRLVQLGVEELSEQTK